MRDPLWGFAPWLHIQPPLCPGLDAPAVLLGFLSLLPRSRLLHLLFLLPAQKLPPRPFRSPPLAQVLLLPEDYPASPPSQQLHPALPAAPPPPPVSTGAPSCLPTHYSVCWLFFVFYLSLPKTAGAKTLFSVPGGEQF